MADFDIMNSPNFGEAGGLAARDDSMLQGLRAREIMGKISMEPETRAHTQAQTRNLNAEAGTREEAARVSRELARLAAEPPPENGGAPVDPLERIKNLATRTLSVAPLTGIKMLEDLSQIQQHRASAAASGAAQTASQVLTQRHRTQRLGALAQAALQNPGGWDVIRMQGQSEGFNFGNLPEDFAEAAQILGPLAQAAVSSADQLKAQAAALEAESRNKLRKAQINRANAGIGVSEARTKVLKQHYDFIARNDGDLSPASTRLKNAIAANLETTANARRELAEITKPPKNYPLLPGDPTMRRKGVPYANPNGVLGVWDGKEMKLYTPPKVKGAVDAATSGLDGMANDALRWLWGEADNTPDDTSDEGEAP